MNPNEPQSSTDKVLSPSMMNRLSDSEETRQVIPAEDRQEAMKELGHAAAHDLPAPGEDATLRFSDGHETSLTVTDYTKGTVGVEIPTSGDPVQSNVELKAFEQLTRETRTEEQPK